MSVVAGFAAACLEFAAAFFLVRWARMQEYESTAAKLNWPHEAIDVLNRRKLRNFCSCMIASACIVVVWRLARTTIQAQPYTAGTVVAAGAALAYVASIVVSFWWVRGWRRDPGWPPLPRKYW